MSVKCLTASSTVVFKCCLRPRSCHVSPLDLKNVKKRPKFAMKSNKRATYGLWNLGTTLKQKWSWVFRATCSTELIYRTAVKQTAIWYWSHWLRGEEGFTCVTWLDLWPRIKEAGEARFQPVRTFPVRKSISSSIAAGVLTQWRCLMQICSHLNSLVWKVRVRILIRFWLVLYRWLYWCVSWNRL